MADTFFGFDSTLNNGDNILPPDEDDCLENEEEYDALNDETFGTLEDSSCLDDWEQQHEQYAAENAISSIHSDIENSVAQLLDSPLSLDKNFLWKYTPTSKNGDVFNTSDILSSLEKASKSFIESQLDQKALPSPVGTPQARKFCTVEELEKNLMKTAKPQILTRPMLPPQGYPYHPMLPHPAQNTRHPPPPGLPPMGMPPPGMGHLPHHHHHQMLPPGMMRMGPPPHFIGNGPVPPRPPGFMFPPGNNPNLPMNHPFNFPPPHQQQRNMNNIQQHNNNNTNNNRGNNYQQQRVRHDSTGSFKQGYDGGGNHKDDYAGLMTPREKQWLLNIQLLQLNTGTPYFDDYYFTVFKERKAKNNKENFPERSVRFPNNRNQRNNDRQENSGNTLTPRVYTPLQFENSLGKLQCGSVTAPRKIIDMDIVTPDKDGDNPSASRDSRKTKQLLLELEMMYSQLLKAEDLKNPLAISNLEKLREIKQKQRLRELDLAPTAEQKQEVLRLFKQESEPVVENQHDFIVKIVTGLLQEEKFASFINIRKGKMLLLRTLPHLTTDYFSPQLLEIWTKVLLSLPLVGRRDTAGDNLLPKLHPFFKRYIQSSTMSDILDIVTGLVEVVRQENHRSTPLGHQGKAPLYFVLLNKLGVSALIILLIRTEYLISTDTSSEKQQNDWSNFLLSWAEHTGAVSKVAQPLELIPMQIFNKHCNRFSNLTSDKRTLLEKHFVDNTN